jgi:hypothetical protein
VITYAEQMALLAQKIREEVVRSAGKGLNAARIFLTSRIKEVVSVPAPRKRVTPPGGGIPYYRATTPATVGAPPRKLSGRLRGSVTSEMKDELTAVVGCNARSDRGFNYPEFLEKVTPGSVRSGEHPFIKPTIHKHEQDLLTIVGDNLELC